MTFEDSEFDDKSDTSSINVINETYINQIMFDGQQIIKQ